MPSAASPNCNWRASAATAKPNFWSSIWRNLGPGVTWRVAGVSQPATAPRFVQQCAFGDRAELVPRLRSLHASFRAESGRQQSCRSRARASRVATEAVGAEKSLHLGHGPRMAWWSGDISYNPAHARLGLTGRLEAANPVGGANQHLLDERRIEVVL